MARFAGPEAFDRPLAAIAASPADRYLAGRATSRGGAQAPVQMLPLVLILPAIVAVMAQGLVAAGLLLPGQAVLVETFAAMAALAPLAQGWVAAERRAAIAAEAAERRVEAIAAAADERVAAIEAAAERAEADKALLLREVLHRVNNNLQQLSSLISLEASGVDDPKASEAFRALTGRILAIASVHQRVIGDPRISHVHLGDVLTTLCTNVSGRLRGGAVIMSCSVEPVRVRIEEAISVGLVVNELVLKAARQAASERRRGTIRIDARRSGEDELVVSVTDAAGGRVVHPLGPSIGDRILLGLVTQLGGELRPCDHGVEVTVRRCLREGEADV